MGHKVYFITSDGKMRSLPRPFEATIMMCHTTTRKPAQVLAKIKRRPRCRTSK